MTSYSVFTRKPQVISQRTHSFFWYCMWLLAFKEQLHWAIVYKHFIYKEHLNTYRFIIRTRFVVEKKNGLTLFNAFLIRQIPSQIFLFIMSSLLVFLNCVYGWLSVARIFELELLGGSKPLCLFLNPFLD